MLDRPHLDEATTTDGRGQRAQALPARAGRKVGLAASYGRPLVPAPKRASRPFFARSRYLARCRRVLSASAKLGAAERPGAGLSLRPYIMARRPLLLHGLRRVEQAAIEAERCAPAPLTAPCACAMTPATPCTDPAPPDAFTRRLTPSRPTAAQPLSRTLLRRCSREGL